MKLYFLRHGESVSNFEDRHTGQQDVELTEKGRAQAVAAGKAMLESGRSFDQIISSPLARAHETATIIAGIIGYAEDAIIDEPLVMERYFGSLEGKTKRETGPLSDEMIAKSGAETDERLRERARQLLGKIPNNLDAVLVVSHNGFGKRLRSVIEGTDPLTAWRSPEFPNGALVELADISK
jgi:broad specificity phosphatase PhoE